MIPLKSSADIGSDNQLDLDLGSTLMFSSFSIESSLALRFVPNT
jgi:hypothetical protein